MSEEESNMLTSRELTRMTIEKIDQHAKESAEFRSEMRSAMAEIRTHNEYTKEKLKDHSDDIKKHNKFMWAAMSTGAIGTLHALKNWIGL